jgi:FkbM family methyltransferase
MKKALKHFYNVIPMKKQLFSFFKHFYSPSENIYKHLHFKGDFDVLVDEKHPFKLRHYGFQIENEVFWGGLEESHEKLSTNLWVNLSRQADIVLDIGANTGLYSLVTKSLNPKTKVYAFEPVKRVHEKLCENNALNKYDIVCLELAASNTTGTAVIYDTPTEHVYSVTVGKNLNDSNVQVIPTTIKTIRLDEFIESENIKKIDLMKIDVETHEAEVLEGLGKYLELFRPTILIEILNDEVGRNVENLVIKNNYLYFNIDDKNNSLKQTNQIKKSDFYNYLLCDKKTARELSLI